MLAISAAIDAKLKILEEREQQHDILRARVSSNQAAAKMRVSVNVGGHIFSASKDVFLSQEDTYFHAMLGGDWEPDEDGTYFIDRNPKHFGCIMESLRSGKHVEEIVAGMSAEEVVALRAEADYYQLPTKPLHVKPPQAIYTWDAARCSRNLTFGNAGRTVTLTENQGDCWSGVLATAVDTPNFTVRVEKGPGIAIGYAKDDPSLADGEIFEAGWLLMPGGWVYNEERWDVYCDELNVQWKEGDMVTVCLDKAAATLSFIVNGKDYGVAYRNVNNPSNVDALLLPCVFLSGEKGVSVELLFSE